MPMVYGVSLATSGNLTTNGSVNTETETFFVKPGVRNVALQALYLIGKGAGLTAISGIVARVVDWATASTGGTAIVPQPKDPGMQAAKATSASRPASGSTRKNHLSIGCGAAGPGGWVAPNPDSQIVAQGGGTDSTSVLDASGTATLAFEFSAEICE